MELLNGDCLDVMRGMNDNIVNTWVTSPPYAKQRQYNGAESKDYLKFLSPIIIEAKRILKDDGSIFINIKEHCDKGQRDLYVFKMIIHFVEVVGLRFVDEFVWTKTNPFPTGSSSRLKDGFERVLHFTKIKKHKFYPNNVLVKSESKWLESEKKRSNKGSHNTKNGSGMNMSKRIASDMVRPSNVIKGTSSNLNIGHPAVYPEYLPEFFINLTTNEGDTVGDMFMVSGTTGIVCKKTKRNFIGIELDKEYFELAQKRIKEETAQLSLF